MSNKSIIKFASELKSLREKKAISLSEIHDKTRIDVKYLSEIENGNLEVLPEVYIRAFLKKYAAMIDQDEDEILSKYEIAKGENPETVNLQNSKKIELDKEITSETSGTYDDLEEENSPSTVIDSEGNKRNIFLFVSGILIATIIVVLYLTYFQNSTEEIIIEKPINEIISDRNENDGVSETKLSDDGSNPEVVTPTSNDSLRLTINAIDTVWMRVMIDSKFGDEFIINPNLSRSLKAKSKISILIGNAGGVNLILNGNKLPKVGRNGEIKNISIDSEGIHYLKIKKP